MAGEGGFNLSMNVLPALLFRAARWGIGGPKRAQAVASGRLIDLSKNGLRVLERARGAAARLIAVGKVCPARGVDARAQAGAPQRRFTDTDPMRQFVNRWGSTFIFASFVITSVTGVMLYFHVRAGSTEALHIWIGFLMIAAAFLHIARNWRQFLGYFRKPAFYGAVVATAMIGAWLSFPVMLGTQTASEGGRPNLRSAITISQAVSGASLSDLAPLVHTDANGLMAKLSEMGVAASDPAATLQSVADSAGKSAQELAAALLGGAQGGQGTARPD